MDPFLGHAWIGAIAIPLAIVMAIAFVLEQYQQRQDRMDGVLLSWDDLRLTRSLLIVGSGRDAERFPIGGLSAKVDVTRSPDQPDDEVHLVIKNAGADIRRRQPYSYGASGNAQMFAIKLNMLSGHPHKAADAFAAGIIDGPRSDRHAA
jgi:hypothetical protein